MEALTEVRLPDLPVPALRVMRFAVTHDLSYPEVIAFVRLLGRLPHSLGEFQEGGWRLAQRVAISA